MNSLLHFMNGAVGRIIRIALGVLLVYVGLVTMGGDLAGIVVAVVGLVPLAMGIWGRCLLQFVFPQHNQSGGRVR